MAVEFAPDQLAHSNSMSSSTVSTDAPLSYLTKAPSAQAPVKAKKVKKGRRVAERFQVKAACTNCKRRHRGCDSVRPCMPCVRANKAHSCRDVIDLRTKQAKVLGLLPSSLTGPPPLLPPSPLVCWDGMIPSHIAIGPKGETFILPKHSAAYMPKGDSASDKEDSFPERHSPLHPTRKRINDLDLDWEPAPGSGFDWDLKQTAQRPRSGFKTFPPLYRQEVEEEKSEEEEKEEREQDSSFLNDPTATDLQPMFDQGPEDYFGDTQPFMHCSQARSLPLKFWPSRSSSSFCCVFANCPISTSLGSLTTGPQTHSARPTLMIRLCYPSISPLTWIRSLALASTDHKTMTAFDAWLSGPSSPNNGLCQANMEMNSKRIDLLMPKSKFDLDASGVRGSQRSTTAQGEGALSWKRGSAANSVFFRNLSLSDFWMI